MASNMQPALAWHANERHCAGCLSGGGRTRRLAPHARAAPRWLWSVTHYRSVQHRWKASLFRRKTVVRRASCELQRVAGICVARARAPLRWSSLGRWHNMRACRARALCRAGWGRPTRRRRIQRRWKDSLFRCKTVVRRASCELQRAASIRVARTRAPLHWLSLGRWHNTRACRVRAPCISCYDRSTRDGVTLHRREASLLRCKTVVRRESCGLKHAVGIRVARERAPLCWLSLGRWQNTRACRLRVPCRAGCDRSTRNGVILHRRKASLLWCKTVERRPSCGLLISRHSRGTRTSATALAICREVAKHAGLPCARAVPRSLRSD